MQKAGHGGKRTGAGRRRQFIYKKVPINWGRGHDQEFAPPVPLSPEVPTDPSDIVIAQNDDGRYGIYLEDTWYGAGQALVMLDYLRQHEAWLREKAQENIDRKEQIAGEEHGTHQLNPTRD